MAAAVGRGMVMLLLAVAGLVAAPGAHDLRFRVYLAAGAATFNLVQWEVRHLRAHAGSIQAGLMSAPSSSPSDLELIRDYLLRPRATRAEARWVAERAIERELSAIIAEQGLARSIQAPVPGLFPPVAFTFTAPPSVLIVSPRDRLVVNQSLFLEPGLADGRIQAVEGRVDGLGVSSLVTPIGGLATYPAMVVESGRPGEVLSAVAHEWAHAYLVFTPLGASYWSSQEGRAINETVADLAGRELGALLAERAGLPPPDPPSGGRGDQEFRQEMRATRLEVERLLSAGAIEEAEAYMERRRLELAGQGYRLRRLNQAYFAFHGSYAETGAGDNRVGRLVRDLRASSDSLPVFLARVSGVQSVDELRRLVSQ